MTAIIRSRPQGSALSVCQATVLTLNLLQLTIVVPVVQDNLCPFHLENSGGYSRGLQQSLVSHCQIGVCDWIFMFFVALGFYALFFHFYYFCFGHLNVVFAQFLFYQIHPSICESHAVTCICKEMHLRNW